MQTPFLLNIRAKACLPTKFDAYYLCLQKILPAANFATLPSLIPLGLWATGPPTGIVAQGENSWSALITLMGPRSFSRRHSSSTFPCAVTDTQFWPRCSLDEFF